MSSGQVSATYRSDSERMMVMMVMLMMVMVMMVRMMVVMMYMQNMALLGVVRRR